MARTLPAPLDTASKADSLRPFLALKLEFPSDSLRVWSGLDSISLFGESYDGAGDLIRARLGSETDDLRAEGSRFDMNGVSSALISLALQEDYQGRPARLYLGALDAAGQTLSDPVQIAGGDMDVISHVDRGDTADFTLLVESSMRRLEVASRRRFTVEDQHIDFPLDDGLAFVTQLQNAAVVWG